MSFGWSAGDIVAAISLVNRITSSIRNIGGAREHFQELISELDGLQRALEEISSLANAADQMPEIIALKFASCNCGAALERFYEKIRPFEESLSNKIQSKWKASPRMVRWELLVKKDVPELRTFLVAHVGYLNMRLSTATLQSASRSRIVTNSLQRNQEMTLNSVEQLNAQALELMNMVTLVSKRDTIPTLESLMTMATSIWRANNDMMEHLQKVYENSVTLDMRFTWAQAPVKFEDALGRIMPIPSEYDLPKVIAIIQTQFRAGWEGAKVRSGEFELYENGSPCFISSGNSDRLRPGSTVTMFIIIGQYAGSARCPRIGCTPPLGGKEVRSQGPPAKSSSKARNDDWSPQPKHRIGLRNGKLGSAVEECPWCHAEFVRNHKALPRPIKTDIHLYQAMNKSVLLDNNLTLQTSYQDRRAVKNLSLYITELPPTPLPKGSSKLRRKKNQYYTKTPSAPVYQAPKPRTKRGAQSVVDSVEVLSRALPLAQNAKDEPSSSDSEENFVYGGDEEQREYSRPAKQRLLVGTASRITLRSLALAARHDHVYRSTIDKRLLSQMKHVEGDIEDGDDERTPLVLAKRPSRSGRPRKVDGNRSSACCQIM